MADIYPASSTNGDPRIGGFVAVFPSGAKKVVAWAWGAPILGDDRLDASKQYASALLADLLKDGLTDDADRTNWASMTAAIQKIIVDWSDALVVTLHANATPIQ